MDAVQQALATPVQHKFLAGSHMTFQEVFDFAFKSFVPVLHALAQELGEAQVLEVLKRLAGESARQAGEAAARQLPLNDFAAFHARLREANHFWQHVLTLEIVQDTPQVFEVRVTECLWAKTFREMGAAEIGYLLICHPDYAYCQGFNPKICMSRSKTLMQGDSHCDHRWVWDDNRSAQGPDCPRAPAPDQAEPSADGGAGSSETGDR